MSPTMVSNSFCNYIYVYIYIYFYNLYQVRMCFLLSKLKEDLWHLSVIGLGRDTSSGHAVPSAAACHQCSFQHIMTHGNYFPQLETDRTLKTHLTGNKNHTIPLFFSLIMTFLYMTQYKKLNLPFGKIPKLIFVSHKVENKLAAHEKLTFF